MAIEIDSLEIEISASAQSAAEHIKSLTDSLEALRKVTNKKFGDITGVFEKIRSFTDTNTLGNISEATEKIQRLADALSGLKDAVGGKLGGVAKEIQAISKAASADIAKGALENAKGATQKVIPLSNTEVSTSDEVKKQIDDIVQADSAMQDLANSTKTLITEALHAPDAVNQLKTLTSQIIALRDELYKGAREGTLSKEEIDKNVNQIQALFNKGFALRLPEGTVPEFEELKYTISNLKDFQGEISGFINKLSSDEARMRRIGADISLTFEKMGDEMRRSGVSIADPSLAKYIDKIAKLRDEYYKLDQSIRRFKESVSTDFNASINESLALPKVISEMRRLEAEMISVRRSLVEGGKDGNQASKEWEDGIKRVRKAYDEFERIKIPDSVLANSEYVSQIEAITDRVKILANVQEDSKETTQLFRTEIENTVAAATSEELKLQSLTSQIQVLYDTIAKARTEGAAADDPIVTKGKAKLKSLYEQYASIEEKIQKAASRAGIDFSTSIEKSLNTPRVINEMKLIEAQIYAMENALIESSKSSEVSGETFYKSILRIQSVYERFKSISIPDSVLANPEYAAEIQAITERVQSLVYAREEDTASTRAAADAARDFYAEINNIVSGTTREEAALGELSAQISATAEKLNQLFKNGAWDSPEAWKQVQSIQRLREEYDALRLQLDSSNFSQKNGGALNPFSYNAADRERELKGIEAILNNVSVAFEGLARSAEKAGTTVSNSILNFTDNLIKSRSAWTDLGDAFGRLEGAVSESFDSASNVVKSKAASLGEKLKEELSKNAEIIKQAFADLAPSITPKLKEIGDSLKTEFESDKEIIKKAFSDLLPFMRYVGASILQPIQLAGETIGTAFSGAKSLLSPLKTALGSDMPEVVKKAESAINSLIQKLGGMLLGAAKQAAGAVLQLSKNIVTTPYVRIGNLVTGFVKKLTGLYAAIKRIVFYRTIRRAIQILSQSITAGIQNLYQYSRIVDTSFHSAMDSVATDILYIKNSVGSVAGIIMETLAPAIDILTDKIASAAALTAEFLAGITGRTTFSRAKKQAAEYADSIDGIGDAAKQAKQNLIGIDELTILGDKGLTQDYSTMFEEVPVSNSMTEAIAKLKDSLSGIPEVITTAWEMTGLDMVDAWKDALKSVLDLLGTIREMFVTVFTDGHGLELLNSIFELFKTIANIIKAIADAFKAAWDDGERGRKYVESIFEMFTKINNLLIGIGKTFEAAWSNGIGEEIAKNLLEIFTGIHDTIGNLAESIRRAWEDTGLGEEIWNTILTIVNDVLTAVNHMVQATADWAKELDFEPLFAAADKALKALEPLVKLISDGLAWAWENVLLPFGKWTIEEAMPAVLETVEALFKALTDTLEALKPGAQWIWENFLQPLAQWTGEAFIGAMKEITDLLNDFADLVSGRINFGEFIGNLSAIQTVLVSIGITLGTIKALSIGSAVVKFVQGGFLGKLSEALALAAGGAGTLHEAMMAVFGPASIIAGIAGLIGGAVLAITNFKAMLENGFSWAHEALMVLGIAIAGIATAVVFSIPGSVAAAGVAIVAAIATLVILIKEHGAELIEGLKEGVANALKNISAWLKEHISDPIVNGVKALFGIHSPSTVFSEIGENLIQGLLNGISDFWKGIVTFFTEKWENLKQGFSDTWEGIKGAASSAWEGITTTLSGFWEGIKTKASEKFDKVKETVSGAWETVKDTAGRKWEGITSIVGSAVENVRKAAYDKFESVKSTVSGVWDTIRGDTSTATREIQTATQTAWVDVRKDTVDNWRDVKTAIADATREVKQSPGIFTSFSSVVSGAFGAIRSAAQTALSVVTSSISQIAALIAGKVSSISQSLSTTTGAVSSSFSRVQETLGRIASNVAQTVSNASTQLASIQTNAEGAYGISTGQLFIAREAGPELVGRIGNQNTVANNEQIVEGIASGVSEANEEVVNAIYVGIARVIETIEENRSNGGNLDYRRLSQLITQQQYRTAKMNP